MRTNGFAARAAGAAACVLLLCGAARAADPAPAPAPAGPRTLTLEEVRRLALENGRDIRRAEQYAIGVQGRYLEERAAALPQLTLSAYGSDAQDNSVIFGPDHTRTVGTKAVVDQPLYTFGRIAAAIRAAKSGLATAGDRMRQARQTALRDGLVAWYDALLAAELRSIAGEDLAGKERHLDEVRRRVAAGTATDYDVLSAEVAVQNARPLVIRADNLIANTRERLRFVLALEEGVALELRGELAVDERPLPAYAAALEEARRLRPDLAELRNQQQAAAEVVTIRRAGTKPRIDFRGAVGWQEIQVDGPDGEGDLWSAGVALTWPIFDGQRTKGLVMEAESAAGDLAVSERDLLDSIALEVRRAVDDLREATEIAAALAGTAGQAERLLAMSETGYRLGVKTSLDVDDARVNLLQARGNLARARRDCLSARTALAFVTGTLE
jgi:HAE1 family hydrophobic/amphiphilic exporter-1